MSLYLPRVVERNMSSNHFILCKTFSNSRGLMAIYLTLPEYQALFARFSQAFATGIWAVFDHLLSRLVYQWALELGSWGDFVGPMNFTEAAQPSHSVHDLSYSWEILSWVYHALGCLSSCRLGCVFHLLLGFICQKQSHFWPFYAITSWDPVEYFHYQ